MELPEARRARLSGYVEGEGEPLPFAWVDERLRTARTYWITVQSPGFPCSRPVWGLWWPPVAVFSTGGALARHMERSDRVQVSVEAGDDVVLIEGRARPLGVEDVARWVRGYREKYAWDMPETPEGVYRVEPARILAWSCDNSGRDAGAAFHASATEWHFTKP